LPEPPFGFPARRFKRLAFVGAFAEFLPRRLNPVVEPRNEVITSDPLTAELLDDRPKRRFGDALVGGTLEHTTCSRDCEKFGQRGSMSVLCRLDKRCPLIQNAGAVGHYLKLPFHSSEASIKGSKARAGFQTMPVGSFNDTLGGEKARRGYDRASAFSAMNRLITLLMTIPALLHGGSACGPEPDPHPMPDVLEGWLATILECCIDPARYLLVRVVGQADAAGLSQLL
jgi:hypothetical protein